MRFCRLRTNGPNSELWITTVAKPVRGLQPDKLLLFAVEHGSSMQHTPL